MEENKVLEVKDENLESEMMRYRTNGLSYKLGFGGIICSVIAAFVCLNSFNPNNFLVIVKILMNIAILLFGFLNVEKAKAYSKNGSIVLMAIGVVNILRIFWVPLLLIINYNKWVNAPEAEKTQYEFILGRTITNRSTNLINYLPQDGNFRGIMAIIFLIASAAFFFAAGIIGYKRSVKLEAYMKSINESK